MKFPIEKLLTDKNPAKREMAKKLRTLQFPITYYNVGWSIDIWCNFVFLIHLPKGCLLELGRYPSKNDRGWYCLYQFEDQRWTGLGDNFTFDQVFEEIKTITEDIRAGGKITWGFWNYV